MRNIGRAVLVLAAFGTAGWVGAVEYAYDNLNRLTWVKYSSGAQINYVYDAAGNLTYRSQIAAPATPPGAPTLNGITPGPGRVTLNFTAPVNTGGSPIAGYTATCTANGQPTRTASGTASPLTVTGLTGNVSYSCSLTATNGGGATSVASATLPVTPAPAKKGGLSAILMLLLD
ncbi:MAG: fibronectin type III domain-containing protein [Betaproteobacteria bacterium]|nr:fibronectin type III domain-containing protein [Betaproteobacteria bacterium]